MKYKEHKIVEVEPGSIAEELEIEAGDTLLWINKENIQINLKDIRKAM